jgi:hypothetical protein
LFMVKLLTGPEMDRQTSYRFVSSAGLLEGIGICSWFGAWRGWDLRWAGLRGKAGTQWTRLVASRRGRISSGCKPHENVPFVEDWVGRRCRSDLASSRTPTSSGFFPFSLLILRCGLT